MEHVNIEIVLKNSSKLNTQNAVELCENFVKTLEATPGAIYTHFSDEIAHHVVYIIMDDFEVSKRIDLSNVKINWLVYKLHHSGPFLDNLDCDGNDQVLSTSWILPSNDFHGLWENLIYDFNIKKKLLKYAETTMLFSDKGIDSNIVCSNRVVLLHGPPGTGKTSLCKALAHKLSIHFRNRYKSAQLVEVNTHSLFSKWFSESGKLVSAMFSKIRDIIDDNNTLVFVLIDEVESLAHARQQCMSGNEPSDSIRVVNAVLTEIDQIKRFPNVLVLTTSNMTGAIDLAFVDRADIKQFIGLPTAQAIYQIYYSCLKELMRAEIIVPAEVILPATALNIKDFEQNCVCDRSKLLKQICDLSLGFSGRTLRKVPFIAHALFLQEGTASFSTFIDAMRQAIEYLKNEKNHFEI